MFHKSFQEIGNKILNIFLPPLCYGCQKPLFEAQKLCGECWVKLQFIRSPSCVTCGLAFDVDMGEFAECLSCLEGKHSFDLMRSVLKYDEFSKKLIMRFKHNDRTELLPLFMDWFAFYVKDFQSIDIVIPVPLHWKRLFKRKYNQSALLAQKLAKNMNVFFDPFSLKRIHATQPQHGNKQERALNMKDVFAVSDQAIPKLKGKTILLIDDVVTTGATIKGCAEILKEKGAQKVFVLSLARVNLPL